MLAETRWRLAVLGLVAVFGPQPSQTLVVGSARSPLTARPALSPLAADRSFSSAFQMQEGDSGGGDGGERSRSRSRTITVARPKPKAKGERKEDVDQDKSWRVLLHNDDVRKCARTHTCTHSVFTRGEYDSPRACSSHRLVTPPFFRCTPSTTSRWRSSRW